MRLYVSHPITGVPDWRERAQRAAALVANEGYDTLLPEDIAVDAHEGVACPASTVVNDGHAWQCWMRADLIELLKCDGIVMAQGWKTSHGARAEMATALTSGMPVFVLIGATVTKITGLEQNDA